MIPHNEIIDPWSTEFVDALVRRFNPELSQLLRERDMRRDHRHSRLRAVLEQPPVGRRDSDWRCAPPPPDLVDRRVEITGPASDFRMAVKALNSGAQGYMVDGEDSLAPTWEGVLRTQSTLTGISRRTLGVLKDTGDVPIRPDAATLHYRPRGLHLVEKHWQVDGRAAPAALVDVGLFLFHNARELVARGSGPYVYLAKLESEWEARFWDRVFDWCEEWLGLPRNTVRTTILVETLPGLLRLEDIVWAQQHRLTGLNVGRWDWIFSAIKTLNNHADYVLPNRGAITMDTPPLAEYARWVVNVAHRRGCHAIGGMAAQVPSRKDPDAAAGAHAAVRRDKAREVALGHDGTWVAHPDLVSTALAAWEEKLGDGPNQLWVVPGASQLDVKAVTSPPSGPRTAEGVREAVRTVLRYTSAWLDGNGCVALDGKMEDAATAEICRALLWQWVARGADLDDGTRVTVDRVDAVVRGETEALVAEGWTPRPEAVDLLVRHVINSQLPDYLTTDAYEVLTTPKVL